jgi:hypothetical protein
MWGKSTANTYRAYEAGKPPRDGSLGFLNFALEFDIELSWLLGMYGALPPRFRLRVVFSQRCFNTGQNVQGWSGDRR